MEYFSEGMFPKSEICGWIPAIGSLSELNQSDTNK